MNVAESFAFGVLVVGGEPKAKLSATFLFGVERVV